MPGAGTGGFPGPQPHSLIVCVTAFSSPPALRRRGAVTRHYQLLHGRYRPLHSGYGAVTSRYGAVTNLTSRYGVGWLQRACAVQRHSLRSQPSSEGLAPWVVPSALLPQGDSLWLAPSAHVCGRLLGREAGRWPTSWGYHSTSVRILQWGWQGPRTPASARRWGRMVLSWLAPSISKGSGLACAAIPPAPPSNVFGNRGTRCTPGGGCAPCTLLGGGRRRCFPTWRVGMLPSQGKGMGPLRSAI